MMGVLLLPTINELKQKVEDLQATVDTLLHILQNVEVVDTVTSRQKQLHIVKHGLFTEEEFNEAKRTRLGESEEAG